MDVAQFAEIFEEQMAISDGMLNSKRKEYAGEKVDVLHNFRQAAHLEQCTLRQALGGFLVKHIVSVFDMIHEDELRAPEVWDEKITDTINYMVLLKAIVIEEEEKQAHPASDNNSLAHIRSLVAIPDDDSPEIVFTPDTNTGQDNDA